MPPDRPFFHDFSRPITASPRLFESSVVAALPAVYLPTPILKTTATQCMSGDALMAGSQERLCAQGSNPPEKAGMSQLIILCLENRSEDGILRMWVSESSNLRNYSVK